MTRTSLQTIVNDYGIRNAVVNNHVPGIHIFFTSSDCDHLEKLFSELGERVTEVTVNHEPMVALYVS